MQYDFLDKLGIKEVNHGASIGGKNGWIETTGKELISRSPINNEPIAKVIQASPDDYAKIVEKAQKAFKKWRMKPAPKRGEIVRQIGNRLRKFKEPLGKLVTLEMGKIVAEGEGEVQEMIDIADFAVGQSRMLYGYTMHSERPRHRMFDQYHPYGIVGIITAFNFPVAVWAWNALIAAMCGDVNLWKPSSKAPLCGIAVQNILEPIVDEYNLEGIFNLVIGRGATIGEELIHDKKIPLISATGSIEMGKHVGKAVGQRLGRTILELGGNNAVIITEDADLEMAIRTVLFGAVGTAGQRCTTTRRVIVQKSIKDEFVKRLIKTYKQVKIGDPLEKNTLMGPLIDELAIDNMMDAIAEVEKAGGKLLYGGNKVKIDGLEDGFYVEPTIMEARNDYDIVQSETFAPILYVIEYEEIDEAIQIHNHVPQGLSSSIFTNNVKYEHLFLSHEGSDCGIANVNIGTSGAEIGGAFGGEKETGGGRESGSDAWKAYMRRQTNTINWGDELPLAQGIEFDVD
ncbi:MAG: aldehyde dehydrogenase family protein [Candidatus Marinimicrobia bacterium]|nr:aldehyde dehydrogenase family protein [Candidatus Neomarinimicrobiota bacterium]